MNYPIKNSSLHMATVNKIYLCAIYQKSASIERSIRKIIAELMSKKCK